MLETLKFWHKYINASDSMKKHINLTVDENLIKVAKMNNINLSQLLEAVLSNGENRPLSRKPLVTTPQEFKSPPQRNFTYFYRRKTNIS